MQASLTSASSLPSPGPIGVSCKSVRSEKRIWGRPVFSAGPNTRPFLSAADERPEMVIEFISAVDKSVVGRLYVGGEYALQPAIRLFEPRHMRYQSINGLRLSLKRPIGHPPMPDPCPTKAL
jgi:hypothetical protein